MVPRSALGLLLALAVATAAAAEPASMIAGAVSDESGRALSGVTVELAAVAGGASQSATTDAAGAYRIAAPAPGRYRLAFRLPSFATSVRTVSLAGGAEAKVDVVMRVGLATEVLVTSGRTLRNLTDLDEPVNGLLGLASAGSEGVVAARLIAQRPVFRAGEIFETVPGVVVSQHSGEGKANQYYVRGFNVDHGTDLATFVADVPVNMPTHGHGQGYSDNNFVIPELVAGVQYQKGTYQAEQGDFSAAGSIHVSTLSVLDRPLFKLEGGQGGFGRALVAASSKWGDGHLLYAAEAERADGPWVIPDDYRKLNGVLRYSRGTEHGGLSLTAMAYQGRWHSTDQVPERALRRGEIDRFGAVDPTDRGRTHRVGLSGEWRRRTAAGLTQVKAYAIDYGLDLFSNFTYFLDDPVRGDQFEQKDDRRIVGGAITHRFLSRWLGRDTESVIGFQGRWDAIPAVGLYRTQRTERLATVREDVVDEKSGAALFQTSVQWTPALRTIAGLRGDAYAFDVRSRDSAHSGRRTAALASPKLSLVLGPWRSTEVYANWGLGFHSNDARGAVQTREASTGAPVRPVDPIVRARGAELGLRTLALRRYHSTLAVWGLDLASELVFVGDAGTTEPTRPSRRLGIEWSNVFTPRRWLTLDADLAWSRARFRDRAAGGQRIPGAVEGVVSAGATVQDLGRFAGSLRLRYFGARPLIDDDSVRSRPSTTLSARASWRLARPYLLTVDVFNLTDARASDIDYYYRSRLPGEPMEGVADVHTHPLAPRTVRVGLTATF